MRAALRSAADLLRAAVAFGALAALSCAGTADRSSTPEAPAPPSGLSGSALEVWEGCARHGGSADLFTYCLGTRGDRLDGVEAVEQLCPQAATWENACRLFFVLAACGDAAGYGRDALLDACAGDEDCVLEVLNCRHEDDLVVQLELCGARLTRLRGDCAAHAYDRWLAGAPDGAERARVADCAPAAGRPIEAGRALARAIACAGEGECTGPPGIQEACLEQLPRLSTDGPDCTFEAPYTGPPAPR